MDYIFWFIFTPIFFVLIIPVLYLLCAVSQLKQQVRFLAQKLQTKGPQSVTPVAAPAPAQALAAQPQVVPQPPVEHKEPQLVQEPDFLEIFVKWLKKDWIMKVGAFFMLLALAWFVRYSFANNWIGPMGRIMLGFVVGTILLLIGHDQIPNRSVPGQVLVITGATMLLTTVFSARYVYNFFDPVSALGLSALVIIMTSSIAVLRGARVLGSIALLGGAIAPLLTNAPSPDMTGLMTYIVFLNLGMFLVVFLRGWREIIVLALLVTAAYSFGLDDIASSSVQWFFMALFYALFYGASLSAAFRNRRIGMTDLLTTGGISLLMIGWIIGFVPEVWQGLILALLAVVPVLITSLLQNQGFPRQIIYVHGAAGTLSLAVATAIELSGEALIVAFTIEILALIALCRFVTKDQASARNLSFLLAIPTLLSVDHMESYMWRYSGSVLNEHFFILLLLTAAFFATAKLLSDRLNSQKTPKSSILHLILGSIFAMLTIWRSMEFLLSYTWAHGVSLVIFTLAGLFFFFRGLRSEHKGPYFAGMAVLSFVALRLLLVEMWIMPLTGRIVFFALIGLLLLSTAFFLKQSHED